MFVASRSERINQVRQHRSGLKRVGEVVRMSWWINSDKIGFALILLNLKNKNKNRARVDVVEIPKQKIDRVKKSQKPRFCHKRQLANIRKEPIQIRPKDNKIIIAIKQQWRQHYHNKKRENKLGINKKYPKLDSEAKRYNWQIQTKKTEHKYKSISISLKLIKTTFQIYLLSSSIQNIVISGTQQRTSQEK